MTDPPSTTTLHESEAIDEKTLEAVGTIGVFDQDGCERPFGGLIRHGTHIVVFIRHFNCGFCQDYLSALKKQLSVDKLDKRELMVIGCGHWSCIKPYKEMLDFPFPIYAENTGKLYGGLGMICNLGLGDSSTSGHYISQGVPSAILTSIGRAWTMGIGKFFQSGKISQLGGELIFRDGKCIFTHRMKNTRDHLEPEDLEQVILKN